jgi:hypothetical protein
MRPRSRSAAGRSLCSKHLWANPERRTDNPASPTLDAVDIVVAGPVLPTEDTVALGANASGFEAYSYASQVPLFIDFSNPLGSSPDPIADVTLLIGYTNQPFYDISVTGEADAPQVAPAPVLGSGLSGSAVLAVLLFAGRAKLRFRQA